MPVYYRFSHDQPRRGETVHCFRTLNGLKKFAMMMRTQDPEFRRMKYWEVEGIFVKDDEGDAQVRVNSSKQINL